MGDRVWVCVYVSQSVAYVRVRGASDRVRNMIVELDDPTIKSIHSLHIVGPVGK
jgi:hypothetical protein